MYEELLAKTADLERRLRRQEAKPTGPTLGEFYAQHLGLMELRGLWTMASVDESAAVYDLSGQGRTLTNNGPAFRAPYNDLIPYCDFTGTEYLSRPTESGLAITGALTFGGWYWLDSFGATDLGLSGKYTAAGNQRSYLLYTNPTLPEARLIVSSDGTAITQVNSGVALSTGAWNFLVGRFTPPTELAIFANGTKTVNTTSIPASIFSSSAAFILMGFDGAGHRDGRASLNFLSAYNQSDALIDYLFQRGRVLFGV